MGGAGATEPKLDVSPCFSNSTAVTEDGFERVLNGYPWESEEESPGEVDDIDSDATIPWSPPSPAAQRTPPPHPPSPPPPPSADRKRVLEGGLTSAPWTA